MVPIVSHKSLTCADTPIYKMCPDIRRSKGWLRLLADEVRGQRCQWEGLKLVGGAQLDLKDYDGARRSWETIRDMYPTRVETNLALANIYERLYKAEKKTQFIELSEQALDRVLNNTLTTPKQRVEALALRGRNQKTRWQLEFESLQAEERRNAAMNRALIRSYEAYRDAFWEDLNHFYSGINALQMATILIGFSKDDRWYELFKNDRQVNDYRMALEEEVTSLQALVPGSVDAALRKMTNTDPDESLWAEISRADVMFLTDGNPSKRVIGAYQDAIPEYKSFAWDAARGQLKLFADLGIKTDLANAVIAANDPRFHEKSSDQPERLSKKLPHVIIFAGHRVDVPTRPQPRFPEKEQDRVRNLIREASALTHVPGASRETGD
jgi:hypothetical protein